MQHQLRYSGTFVSREGIAWQCDILQQSETVFAHVGELRFEAEDPLVIEWHEADKEEPLQTSSATLKIESPGDRTYADLYTIEPGTVRLDILREGRLFWSGTLDPEFYEEPYERASHYPVTLTFSDFGILDRLKFEGAGVLSLSAIVGTAMERACLRYDALDFSTLTSLCFPEEADAAPEEADRHRATLDRLSIVADNFFDEDGEPSTLREVIEGILQPLALRLVQREGQVWVYDLHALYHSTSAPAPIRWTADSQTLSVDKVANSVRVNFSAYAEAGAITDEVEFRGKYTGREWLTSTVWIEGDYADGKYYKVGDETVKQLPSQGKYSPHANFLLYTSRKGKGVEYLDPAARYGTFYPADISKEGAGDQTDCIVWRAQVLNTQWTDGAEYTQSMVGVINPAQVLSGEPNPVLFTTKASYLPEVPIHFETGQSDTHIGLCSIGIKMELLADPRYNPFLEPTATNEEANYHAIKAHSWLVRVPIGVGLYGAQGEPLLHLKCYHDSIKRYQWEAGAPSIDDHLYLDYGSPDDGKDDCGIFGWKENGRIDPSPSSNPNAKDWWSHLGLVLPYPAVGGWLKVTVYKGIHAFNNADGEPDYIAMDKPLPPAGLVWTRKGYHEKLRWLCYKAPEVTIYSNRYAGTKADLDDVEYTGYINRQAKEEINIDTICGTHTEASPTARGVYLRTRIDPVYGYTDTVQLHHLRRAGHTDHPERLLIGTLISQYSRRMTRLSGECAVTLGAHVFTEANQPGRRFLVKGEVLNAQTDTSEASFVEFRPDEWTAIEEVEPKG